LPNEAHKINYRRFHADFSRAAGCRQRRLLAPHSFFLHQVYENADKADDARARDEQTNYYHCYQSRAAAAFFRGCDPALSADSQDREKREQQNQRDVFHLISFLRNYKPIISRRLQSCYRFP
jgi:hypothetical protein